MSDSDWYLYMIRTPSGHLYTGITIDVKRRFSEHQAGKGAKYLRGKMPLQLVFSQQVGNQSLALKTEIAIKKWSKFEKEKLIQSLGTSLPVEDRIHLPDLQE